jgi:hypothetical protein
MFEYLFDRLTPTVLLDEQEVGGAVLIGRRPCPAGATTTNIVYRTPDDPKQSPGPPMTLGNCVPDN